MPEKQMILFILTFLLALIALPLPSFAVMKDVENFDRGKNRPAAQIAIEWLLQFMIYLGIVMIIGIAFESAANYKIPTKNNLIFLSAEDVLANKNSSFPKISIDKTSVNNLNEIIGKHKDVFVVLMDDWAIDKSGEELNRIVQKGFELDAEVVGFLPPLNHKRSKEERIATWLKVDKRTWDSVYIIDTEYFPNFDENSILIITNFDKYKRDLLEMKLDRKEQQIPKIETVAPTKIKLHERPDFGGRRLLKGHEVPTSRKEAGGQNDGEVYRSSSSNISDGGTTTQESGEIDSWLKK